ncbi:hypothetical protein JKG47_09530 [Acidithiobacillus sp. MC6.1]|nr:hypothetical protein [Acidithiobacillus sp. MC6.1]
MTVVSRLHASYLPLQNFPTVLPPVHQLGSTMTAVQRHCSVRGLPLIQPWQTAVEGRGCISL